MTLGLDSLGVFLYVFELLSQIIFLVAAEFLRIRSEILAGRVFGRVDII